MESSYLDALDAAERLALERRLLRLQHGMCYLCEERLALNESDGGAPRIAHIQPTRSGGPDAPANFALVHGDCLDRAPAGHLRLARDVARGAGPGGRATGAHRAPGPTRTYGSALGLTILGAVVPGSAYLAAGRRRLGVLTLGFVVLVVLAIVGVLLIEHDLTSVVVRLASRPATFNLLGVGILAVAALWVIVIATGHRMLLPKSRSRGQRVLGAAVTVLLAVAVVVPSVIAARYAFATHDLIEKVFGNEVAGNPGGVVIDPDDPWKDTPRLNVLLLGADPVPGGGVTTNTMIVASIDTATGDTLLFSLPRNLTDVPIPADNPLHALYPAGYRCAQPPDTCLLSGLYTEAEVTHADLFADETGAGLSTLRGSISEITGLPINYYVLVDLDGLRQLVDALGGIDLDIGPQPVPVTSLDAAGNPLPATATTAYIPPGRQHLDGTETLAFARERTDTFGADMRMLRQRSVVTAIVQQASPPTVLVHYLDLASTAGDAIRTDVPAQLLPALFDLSKLVRAHETRSLPIEPDDLGTTPDYTQVRALVQAAVAAGS